MTSGEASLRKVKISEDLRHTSVAQLAVPASQALSVTVSSSPIQTMRVRHVPFLSTCLASGLASAHASNQQETAVQSFLVCFFLWSPDKWSSTIQCKADQYMCVVSKIYFIICPFHVLALAEHPFCLLQ